MHFIYLDESGDPGMNGSPTNHYILAGFALTASDWHKVQRRFALFRQGLSKLTVWTPVVNYMLPSFLARPRCTADCHGRPAC